MSPLDLTLSSIAATLTRAVRTMWAFYAAAVFHSAGWVWRCSEPSGSTPYPFAFMLFLSSLLQLILEFVRRCDIASERTASSAA